MSRVILALAAIGLVVAVWLSWPDPSADETEPTIPAAASTSSTRALATTSTGPGTTTTGVTTSHVVATVEEAEAILREHYYRWFSGIYEEDTNLIRSTVILEEEIEAAEAQFGLMEFKSKPSEGAFQVSAEILLSDETCLAVWTQISATFRDGSSQRVMIFRRTDLGWKLLSSWKSRDDLWEPDCDSQLP